MWWILALALLALAALGAVLLWRRRKQRQQRRPARRPPRLRHPVVLAHGVLGFDKIAIGGREHSYFRGVTNHLMSVGAEVHKPRVSSSASIAVRAQELADVVRAIPAKKVNVIAHSLGGLDVRYAITKLGLADRVATLTTIGTPHLGTPVADLGTKLSDLLRLKPLIGRVVPLDGFYDLTTKKLRSFNREIVDMPGVAYASVVAKVDRQRTNKLLWLTHKYLTEIAGANDGMVPSASQCWGEVLKEIEADHWAQIGWSGTSAFDALVFYEEILRELRGRGF